MAGVVVELFKRAARARQVLPLFVACAVTWCASLPAQAEVRGAGATFPAKVYQRWGLRYAEMTGDVVRYQATGSGQGVSQIVARAVDFGATDVPLSADELQQRKLVQIPMLVGGIVPVVNLPSVGPNKLLLSGEVLADIMLGVITQWDDRRIAEFNPRVPLPALRIVRVVRADKSGSSEGFARYLSALSPSFKQRVVASTLPAWPGEVSKAEGNDGVVRMLKLTEGGIAYVSHDRVLKDGLAAVRLRNAAGREVAASEAGFRAAIQDSELARSGDDRASLMNTSAPEAWPITLTSFILVDREPADAMRATPVLQFVYWCFMHGDELTRGTGFAPLPVRLQARLASRLSEVRAKDGRVPRYASY
ncbi:MAG: hypothetical protein RJA98_3699 [Pseudomonadota bacterium]|jgi:phosphate transport system substrate-binding protein